MAFNFNLDNISKKLTDLSQNAFNQGTAFADSAKSRFKANEIEKKLNDLYAQLGRKYFEMIKDDPSNEDKEAVDQIIKLKADYEVYAVELRKERGISVCPKCGAEVPYGTAYCSGCGSVMIQPGVTAYVKCPACGKELPTDTHFCTSCGTDVSGVAPLARQMPLGQVNLSAGSILSSPNVMPTQQPMPTQNPMMTQQPMPTQNPMMTQQPMPTQNPMMAQQPMSTQNPMMTQQPMPTQNPMMTQQPMPTQNPMMAQQPMPTQNPMPAQHPFLAKSPMTAEQPAPTQQPVQNGLASDNQVTQTTTTPNRKGITLKKM